MAIRWKTAARIDEAAHIWYAAAKIPLSSVSSAQAEAGHPVANEPVPDRGSGSRPATSLLCWQQTCAGRSAIRITCRRISAHSYLANKDQHGMHPDLA